MNITISNIQRFSLNDGPGIRTVVFLNGCNLRCPWCANPENITFKKEKYYDSKKCLIKNNNCFINGDCPMIKNSNLDKVNDSDIKKCYTKALGCFHKEITHKELINQIMKDYTFYKDGGVTFSGGEPLLQFQSLKEVCKLLKQNNINLCVESCLFIKNSDLIDSLDYFDHYIIDFKIMDERKCKETLNGDISVFLDNIKTLFSTNKDILIRMPIIKNFTDDDSNVKRIITVLKMYKHKNIEIFSGHNLAFKKYMVMNKKMLNEVEVDEKRLNEIKKLLEKNGFNVKIIKL